MSEQEYVAKATAIEDALRLGQKSGQRTEQEQAAHKMLCDLLPPEQVQVDSKIALGDGRTVHYDFSNSLMTGITLDGREPVTLDTKCETFDINTLGSINALRETKPNDIDSAVRAYEDAVMVTPGTVYPAIDRLESLNRRAHGQDPGIQRELAIFDTAMVKLAVDQPNNPQVGDPQYYERQASFHMSRAMEGDLDLEQKVALQATVTREIGRFAAKTKPD